MPRSISMLVAVLALTLACAAGEDANTEDTAADAAGATAQPLQAQLQAQAESGVSGMVTVTPQGNEAAFAMHVMGTAGTYTGHVHQGSCADTTESAMVADLGTVRVPEGGMADHAATAPVAADSLLNGRHFVGLHRQDGGPHIACANLQR